MNNQGSVDAIVLASGFSRRFGTQNKLLSPFKGIPLAQHTLRLACSIPEIDHVWFVCANDEVAALASPFPATVIHNAAPEKGQRESVRLGTNASGADYFLFMPCDQPLLTADILHALLEKRKNKAIVRPKTETGFTSPCLFSAYYKQALKTLPEHTNARQIMLNYAENVISVPIKNSQLLQDIDTIEQLAQLENT